jgi:hypothetical protein
VKEGLRSNAIGILRERQIVKDIEDLGIVVTNGLPGQWSETFDRLDLRNVRW